MRRKFFRIAAYSGRLIFLLVFFLLFACSYREGASVTRHHDGEIAFRKVVVLPFQSMIPERGGAETIRCPLCGAVYRTETVAGDLHPEKAVERIFLRNLEAKTKIEWLSGEKVAGIYQRMNMENPRKNLLAVVGDVGAALGADAVIAGYVFRFRERKGYAYSAERPASVALEIHLIRSSDAVVVWKGTYDRTQSSLLENLLQIASFYRERGRWVTALELADEGLGEIMKSFPVPN